MMKKISILQLIPITAAFIMLSIAGCDKPDKISKWRYVPKEIYGAEVILTINETQGMAMTECSPEDLFNGVWEEDRLFIYWFGDGWQYLIDGDSLFLLSPVYDLDTLLIEGQGMIVKDKTNEHLEVESFGFGVWPATYHNYIDSYDFYRISYAD